MQTFGMESEVHKKKHGVLARLKSIIHRGKLVNSMNKYDEKEEEL